MNSNQAQYKIKNRKFNEFLNSPAGDTYKAKQEQIIADEYGMTVEEMRAQDAEREAEMEAEYKAMPVEWFCEKCGWFEYKGEKTCPTCGTRKISDY